MSVADLLIVDDESTILESISMFMAEKGHAVHTAATVKQALELFEKTNPQVVILDIRLTDGSGLDALRQMKAVNPLARIIMITAFQDMETTIEAMKLGAYDYIHKPLDAVELDNTVAQAIESLEQDRKHTEFSEGPAGFDRGVIVGSSRVMKDVFKMIGMLCQNRATALITGETGTGKELVSRRIHLSSPDKDKPFITFDCSAVVNTLLESELFGHEKGAFTGAVTQRPGKIELAGDGTLFLDEVGELPLNLQAKLLGFLERKEYMRVGGCSNLTSRCRIIAATNQDLDQMVKEKKFRADLYYRLKVVTITLPSLKDRLSDIPLLVDHFIRKCAHDLGVKPMQLQDGCIERLKSHAWTGNVRELENVIISAAIRSRGNVILVETLDALLSGTAPQVSRYPASQSLAQVEKRHIQAVLASVQWNKTRASRILKISLPTLRKKIHKYQLSPNSG
ncbi:MULTISPECIES: sigma-54-dependent transcriptional regulator [Desulfotignum]|jgi:two-component system response regulator AtoC|uniref:sigma-54-dependent transcriptional regulator n=1 Tax=Desulfotignum balticum TaxID=115781 RepID=UPI0004A444AB|nr:sigma-54 dependent transcriptional regulator [Desulfotignum phosphitoxidans]